MIVNLFTRTFLVSPNILYSNRDFVKYINLEDIRIPKSLDPYEYFKQLLEKVKFDQSYIFLVPGGQKQFFRILAKYCALLQITEPNMINAMFDWFNNNSDLWIYRMHEFRKDYKSNYYMLQARLSMYKTLNDYLSKYKDYDKDISYDKDKWLLDAIPAEFYVNSNNDNKYKENKFRSFLVYEIMEIMFLYSNACFSANIDLPKEYMDIQKEAISKNIELKECIMDKYPGDELFEFCKELKLYIQNNPINGRIMDDRGVLSTTSIEEYIDNDKSTRGYSAINIFKYNKYLAKAVKECKYYLPIKLNGDV